MLSICGNMDVLCHYFVYTFPVYLSEVSIVDAVLCAAYIGEGLFIVDTVLYAAYSGEGLFIN